MSDLNDLPTIEPADLPAVDPNDVPDIEPGDAAEGFSSELFDGDAANEDDAAYDDGTAFEDEAAHEGEAEKMTLISVPLVEKTLENGYLDEDYLEGSDAEAYEALKARRAERKRKKRKRRAIVVGILVAVLAIAVAVVSIVTKEPETAPEAVTDVAISGNYVTEVTGRGKLAAISATVVTPGVEGTIASINVQSGQAVAVGDTLLTIKNDSLDEATASAERELKSAKETLDAAYKALKTAEAGTTDPETGEWVASDTTEAQATYKQAQDAVTDAQTKVDAAYAEAAKRTVKAPQAGSIVELNALVGATVSGGGVANSDGTGTKAVMQIADLSQMKVTVQVSEEDIARIAVGQRADVTFAAFTDLTLSGSVTSIASIASSSADYYSGDSEVVFDVEVTIPEPDARLKPGMTANVSIVTEELSDVVEVPVSALKTDDGETYYVEVQKNDDPSDTERVDVSIAAQNDEYAVVGRVPGTPAGDPNAGESADALPESPINDGDTLVIMSADEMAAAGGGADATDAGVDEDQV